MIEIHATPKRPRIDIGINSKENEINIDASKSPGTSDYNRLRNKPLINGVELIGDKSIEDLFPDDLIIDGGTAGGWA